MNAPPQAVAGLVWAILGPVLVAFAATRVHSRQLSLHAALMIACVVIELAVFSAFMFFMTSGSRRSALIDLPFFKIHLAFAIAAFGGIAWQLTSRAVARLRPYHRHTGPYVVLVWCLALLTGIYNYVFLYVMHTS
jgi:uncharacterized membrane protein YozB (DUF420 family)